MRVAIAGAGLMGGWHARYARRCGAAICGVVDPDPARAAARGPLRGAPVFPSLAALFERLKPDALHVCTPAGTHEPIIETALAAGVHLLVEKPMADTADGTERLLRMAAERRLCLVPVHQYAFQDGVVRTLASARRIGVPLHFDATICTAGGAHLSADGLEALAADILPHPLSLLDRYFPGILAGMRWTCTPAGDGEWRIAGGTGTVSAGILISAHGRPTESSARIIGGSGTVRLDLFHGFGFLESGSVSRTRKIAHPFQLSARTLRAAAANLARRAATREPAYPGLRRLIAEFYAAVREKSAPPLTPGHVLAVARARDELRLAAGRARAGQAPGPAPSH